MQDRAILTDESGATPEHVLSMVRFRLEEKKLIAKVCLVPMYGLSNNVAC
jgi:hypothetical protein